tara:strand:+ start:363 stop:557 length:195 start_codon:yes stop_codon:yes gene_type:complete
MLGHDKLLNFFKTNFTLMQHHKYSLHDIEHMMPWERIVYVELLRLHIKEIEEQNRDRAAANRRR